MRKILFLLVIFLGLKCEVKAQVADSVVQLYGVIMTSDSLRAIPAASITRVGFL